MTYYSTYEDWVKRPPSVPRDWWPSQRPPLELISAFLRCTDEERAAFFHWLAEVAESHE